MQKKNKENCTIFIKLTSLVNFGDELFADRNIIVTRYISFILDSNAFSPS